ncbi:MAG: type IV pilus twitching motility protein PilT [Candidatus Daviesbacteria bacterium]|nr:type IV pilus twitching motility protein PilT [Candidatus Daviesbacteria bacterium]
MTIHQFLELTIARDASDLHLIVGFEPQLRIHGELLPVPGTSPLTTEDVQNLLEPLMNLNQKKTYLNNLELDFSYQLENKGRFRINAYFQKGAPAVALRLIPFHIRPLDELGFPQVISKLPDLEQGFVLITGPTGHGKSTTLAAFINQINHNRAAHIITIEDPIEYVYPKGKSIISQREMYRDSRDWPYALRAALREDPNVVLIGEMRDLETIASAMTIAETGHLVFATLHTNSAAQSVDRIVDVFPENQQPQIRLQLAATLEAIISLRLVPTINPGRILAVEILFASAAVRNIIREGKTHLIDNLIQTSGELGMTTLENSLASLVKSGKISREVALRHALRPELLSKLIR